MSDPGFDGVFGDTYGSLLPETLGDDPVEGTYSDTYGVGTGEGDYNDAYGDYGTDAQLEAQSPYRLFVRDENYERQALVGELTQFHAVPRFNAYGNWTLTLGFDDPAVVEMFAPRSGIELRYGPDLALSGPCLGILREWTNDDVITFHGVTDDVHMWWRLCYPEPLAGILATNFAYDDREGLCEDLMLALIVENLGALALPERRLAGLTVPTSQGRGGTVRTHHRFDSLGDAVVKAAEFAGLGIRIVADRTGPRVEVYEPRDRSTEVHFSRTLGNIVGYEWAFTAPTANAVIGGGGGNGVARLLLEARNQASVDKWWRIESFVDARDVGANEPLLNDRMAEALIEQGEVYEVKVTPGRDAEGATFMRDWTLGDTVTVEVDGLPTHEQIRSADITIDKDGVRALPVIAGPQRDSLLQGSTEAYLLRLIHAQDERIRALEARQ